MNDHAGALADFSECLRYNPANKDALFNRALTREQLGDMNGAIEDLSSLLQQNPALTKGYVQRGVLKFKSRDADGAKADWRKAAQLGDQRGVLLLKQNFNEQ